MSITIITKLTLNNKRDANMKDLNNWFLNSTLGGTNGKGYRIVRSPEQVLKIYFYLLTRTRLATKRASLSKLYS